ncbi:MAG: flavodoxin family protein [Pseudomonadota bacterium]
MLAINGSPRGRGGATWWVLERFIQGVEEAGGKVEVIQLAGKNIHHCTGELSCWFKTPGKCIHNDDMEEILSAVATANAFIIATPVYLDGMTGLLKNCMDRMVPTVSPHFELKDGHLRHAARKFAARSVALVSTCGFFELDNFGPLVAHVKAICRNMDAEFAGAVLRPAAPMIPEIPTIHPLFFKLRSLTKAIRQAGKEFVKEGRISDEIGRAVSADIVSREKYFQEANSHFDKVLKKI